VLDYDTDGNTTEVTRSFYHRNALGSVMEITDLNEAAVVSYRYDPYGKVTITRGGTPQSADPLGNHWTFTGRFLDEEAALCYYRARYYDPATGRFLHRDPASLSTGPNLFAYVSSGPTLARDPSGMQEKIGDGQVIHGVAIKGLWALVNSTLINLQKGCDCGTIDIEIRIRVSGSRVTHGGRVGLNVLGGLGFGNDVLRSNIEGELGAMGLRETKEGGIFGLGQTSVFHITIDIPCLGARLPCDKGEQSLEVAVDASDDISPEPGQPPVGRGRATVTVKLKIKWDLFDSWFWWCGLPIPYVELWRSWQKERGREE
jgi:RHS repeat-associated protein